MGGRSCGCGKCGCVEKYAAGGGLDVTAQELFGEGAAAVTLFDAASRGHAAAETAISDAVQMLGDVLVGAVNLLSPDCLLFSVGLSEQTEQYLYPLCEHIRTKCYTAGTLPRIEKAKLGELSPLIGAALIPHEQIETEPYIRIIERCKLLHRSIYFCRYIWYNYNKFRNFLLYKRCL